MEIYQKKTTIQNAWLNRHLVRIKDAFALLFWTCVFGFKGALIYEWGWTWTLGISHI